MIRTFLILLCGACSVAIAGEPPASLELSQARVKLPGVTVYLDVRDARENPVDTLDPAQLGATLGDQNLRTEATEPFEKTGEGVAYLFLVDVSKSLKPKFFARVRGALNDWIDALGEADRMAVLSFGTRVEQVSDFTGDKDDLKAKISGLKPADNQTALHQALIRAMQWGQRADPGLPDRRVTVVLSDGLDDLFGGPTRDEVLQQMKTDPVPLYAIGLDTPPVPAKRKEGIEALGRFARTSGGGYVSSAGKPIEEVYAALRTRIREVFRARLHCGTCTADGSTQRLQVTLRSGGLALSDGLELRVLAPVAAPTKSEVPVKPPVPEHDDRWLYPAGALLAAVLAGMAFIIRRRRVGSSLSPQSDTVPTDLPETPVWEPAMAPTGLLESTAPPLAPPSPPAGRKQSLRLVELSGPRRGRDYRLEFYGEAVLGRAEGAGMVIEGDSEISSRHCALVAKDRAIFVRDLESTNGTQVNGVPIAGDYPLQDGDILGIGRTELRILLGEQD